MWINRQPFRNNAISDCEKGNAPDALGRIRGVLLKGEFWEGEFW
jgi:hypothetical protein